MYFKYMFNHRQIHFDYYPNTFFVFSLSSLVIKAISVRPTAMIESRNLDWFMNPFPFRSKSSL